MNPICQKCGSKRIFYPNWKRPAFRCRVCFNRKRQIQRKEDLAFIRKEKEYLKKRESFRRKNDIFFKLKRNLRIRLNRALKKNWKSGSAVSDLGCSIDDFKKHLELQFQPGMTWENHGEWHIDHIIPLSSFDLTNNEQLKIACNYENLQPLWARDNIIKSDRI